MNRQINIDELPSTVEILQDKNQRGTIFIVGTAHFSQQSQDDVNKVIQLTQPDLIVLELCQTRISILSFDEDKLLKESSNMNLSKIRSIMKTSGVIHGIIHILLLNLSAHLTRQLGMAPGGEFRAAFRQAKTIPGCQIVLGDRPVGITLKRAIHSLSLWKKIRLVWSLITSQDRITAEDVEKFKEKDLLEQVIAEMSDQYPELARVFVQERDLYLTYSLNKCLQQIPIESTNEGFLNPVIVAVVGIGHLRGIVEQWKRFIPDHVDHLLQISEDNQSQENLFQRCFHSKTWKYLSFGTIFILTLYLSRSRFRL